MGFLQNLELLNLYDNRLSGDIPSEFGSLINLKYLYLHQNELTNSIPIEIGNLNELIYLYLNNNNLNGLIPIEIGGLLNLEKIRLQNNQLFGQIPENLCDLNLDWTSSVYFNINNNNLCEPYPGCIENYIGNQDTSNCSDLSMNKSEQRFDFKFRSAFPNPFNSTIKIDFELGSPEKVLINIYDVKGRQIVNILDRNLREGNHRIQWDAKNISSGLYFIKMQVKGKTITEKVLLLE